MPGLFRLQGTCRIKDPFASFGLRCSVVLRHFVVRVENLLLLGHVSRRMKSEFTMRHPSGVRTSCRYSMYTALYTVTVAICS